MRDRAQHLDSVPLRYRQHILDAQAAFGGTSCYGAGEALHDRARRVYYERHGIHIGLISDGVRSASGQRNYVTCGGPPPGGIRTSTANRSPFV